MCEIQILCEISPLNIFVSMISVMVSIVKIELKSQVQIQGKADCFSIYAMRNYLGRLGSLFLVRQPI